MLSHIAWLIERLKADLNRTAGGWTVGVLTLLVWFAGLGLALVHWLGFGVALLGMVTHLLWGASGYYPRRI